MDINQIEMERYVLGSMLYGDIDAGQVFRIVNTPDAFTNDWLRSIYETAKEVYEETGVVDFVKVHEFDRRLSASSVHALADEWHYVGADQYLLRLSELGRLRELKRNLSKIDLSGDTDILSVLSDAERALNIASDGLVEDDVVCLAKYGPELLDRVVNQTDPEKQTWVSTRIADLDKAIIGLFRGEITIVAGPPSMGKTMFASDVALFNHTIGKRKTLFVSLDQPRDSTVYRLINSLRQITKERLLAQNVSATVLSDAKAALAEYTGLFLVDRPSLTVPQIRGYARRLKRKHGLDIVVIDYVQQLVWHGKKERRDLELGYMIEELKAIAKDLDVVMIVVSQLSREWIHSIKIRPAKKQFGIPAMWMLRDSGVLENCANLVLFPWRPLMVLSKHPDFGEGSKPLDDLLREYPSLYDDAQIFVGKHKDGATPVIPCKVDIERMRFYSEAPKGRE